MKANYQGDAEVLADGAGEQKCKRCRCCVGGAPYEFCVVCRAKKNPDRPRHHVVMFMLKGGVDPDAICFLVDIGVSEQSLYECVARFGKISRRAKAVSAEKLRREKNNRGIIERCRLRREGLLPPDAGRASCEKCGRELNSKKKNRTGLCVECLAKPPPTPDEIQGRAYAERMRRNAEGRSLQAGW